MLGRASHRLALGTAFIVCAGAAARPAQAQDGGNVFGKITETRLPNGMVVVIQEDHRAPIVSLALRYDAGDRVAPTLCVAPLTTAAMVGGSLHVVPGAYDKLLDQAGRSGGQWSEWNDASLFEVTVPSNHLALPLWLWSDEMGFFDAGNEKVMGAARATLREMRRVSMEGKPAARLDAFANQVLFAEGHPYRRGGCEPDDVARVDAATVQAFHDAWMTPDHAALSIVGDVRTDAALDLARRYFGSLSASRPATAVPRPPVARLSDQIEVDVAAPVPAAMISIRWPTPRLYTVDDARLDVLTHLFVGERTGWLRWKLIDEAKVAVRVTAREHSLDLGSYFQVDVEGASGRTPRDLLAAFDAALAKVAAGAMTQRQIDGAGYEALAHRILDLDSPMTRAKSYLSYEDTVGMASYVKHDIDRFTTIGPGDEHAALERWLPSDRRVVLLVAPNPSAPSGGEVLGTRRIPATSP